MTSRRRCDRAIDVHGLHRSHGSTAPACAELWPAHPCCARPRLQSRGRGGPAPSRVDAENLRAAGHRRDRSDGAGASSLGGTAARTRGGIAPPPQASVGVGAVPDAPHRPASNPGRSERRLPMVTGSPTNDHNQIQSAISFIALQFGGPQRVLAHHQKTPNGLCGACSSVSHVRWPCPIASMALQAEAQQRAAKETPR
jgi:hypothetical protein